MQTKLFYKGIEQEIISKLSKAEKKVKIAVAWFTNPKLFDLILKLNEKEIEIELILCDDKINFTNSKVDFQRLIDSGANVHISQSPNLMHNKFCLIDNSILINGSYNWTLRAEKFNYENILISTDKELIIQFDYYFKELMDETKRIENVSEVSSKSYYSQEEIDLEIELKKENNELSENIEDKVTIEYTDEINEAIKKADLLYFAADHLKCINFCKQIIQKIPGIAEFHLILAKSYYEIRNKNNEAIASAQRAIEINNELDDVYNVLGLAFADKKGNEQSAIKNFNICLEQFPKSHQYLTNRADCYNDLRLDASLLEKLRNQYWDKAKEDYERVISIVNEKSEQDCDYSELHSRAIAYKYFDKIALAKKDIDLALLKYKSISDKLVLNENFYKQMKEFQRALKSNSTV